jgi:iron complex outermembrane receptor protein
MTYVPRRSMPILLATAGICAAVLAWGESALQYRLDIPALPVAAALQQFSKQSGTQLVYFAEIAKGLTARPIKGTYTREQALTIILKDTGLTYRDVNARTIEVRARTSSWERRNLAPIDDGRGAPMRVAMLDDAPQPTEPEPTSTREARAEAPPVEEIIVTARKRDESLATVPASITVFTSEALQNYNIQSFNDYATKTPNVSFTYGGGPTGIADARTVAIRGITGQNLTGTAGATGFYIDDTPIPGSVDPRVLDIDNIEVLKGPQGTLYGESSLGGNVRLITKKPSLTTDDFSFMAQTGATSGGGSADGGGDVIGNVVVVPDRLAVRAVLFGNHDAGYLTRTYPDPSSPAVTDPFLSVPRTSVADQGAVTSYGGSVSGLLKVTDNFEAKVRVMFQDTKDYGFPATFAPLPAFTPIYTVNRAFDVQPHAADKWALPSLDLSYAGQGWTLISSSSYFYRHTSDIEDSTYGTQQVFSSYYKVDGLPAQPYLWDGERYHDQFTEELRLSFDPINNVSGTVGAFYSKTHSKFEIPPTYAEGLPAATVDNTVVGPWPNDLIWEQSNPGVQKDTSVFGELYYKFLKQFTLTLGARQYWLSQDADYTANGFMNYGPTPSAPQHNSQSGFNPKVGLSYQATDDAMVYASASKGFRAGGAQPLATFCAAPGLPVTDITDLKSDTLWTYEVGTKVQVPNPGILISAAAFHIKWDNLQQQVALPCGYYFDINGEEATINGGELEVSGHLARPLEVRFGMGYEATKITEPGALSIVGIESGSRILGTPAWNASLGAVYTQTLTANLTGFFAADYSYVGNSVSLLNGGLGAESTRPSYSLVNMRFGVDHKQSEISLNFRNVTNAKPNLGDIGYVGYAQYNSAGVVMPQVATLPPFTVLLQYKRNF